MKILLLSAYDAASHRRWRQDLERHLPQYQWTQLSLPPRYFGWRIRGNSLSWAFNQRRLLEQSYDLLIATSMVDLSALRGFIPSLAKIPTLLYFHENQFCYPKNDDQFASVEPQMITLYSALCADALVFNSEFNRSTFLAGAEGLLRRLPDHVPADLTSLLSGSSGVLPVPLARSCFEIASNQTQQLTLIWNHRWEYDKGPERLLAMLKIFFAGNQSNTSPFILHVVGQQFRQQPAAFDEIKQLLCDQQALGQWGYISDADTYRQLLSESHVVLSTAVHDFQGLSVLDAVAAGCVPLLPRRQAYPEWVDESFCYDSDLNHVEHEAQAMARALRSLVEKFDQGNLPKTPDISHLGWSVLAQNYARLFEQLISKSHAY